MQRTLITLIALAFASGCTPAADPPTQAEQPAAQAEQTPAVQPLDLSDADDNLTALVKMRCSLDPAESVLTWWKGTIFTQFPEKAPEALFAFEGFNVCRTVPQEDGTWQFLSRELSFYRDLATGELIDTWNNPFTGETNEVLHVANDPVSHVFRNRNRAGEPNVYPWIAKGDQLMLTMNVPLTYPNPLSPAEFPEESSGPMYVGSEHFKFFTPRAAIDDPTVLNAPASYGWTRIGPWLPWMKMGTKPGNLLYVAQGMKLPGIGDLPQDIQDRIKRDFPEYAVAPDSWYQPNATSWTYYRKVMEQRRSEAQ